MNATYDGPALRSIRRSVRVSLRKVARAAGMTRSHLSKVERGQHGRPVTPAILAAYEKGTGVRLTSPNNYYPPTGYPAPDADRVAAACWQRWTDLIFPPEPALSSALRSAPVSAPASGPVDGSLLVALVEATQPLPLAGPLLTLAGRWRATGGRVPKTCLADLHEPRRPDWICSHCHRLWPCPDARQQLRALHGYQPGCLAAFMSVRLFDAAADLGQAEPSTELVDRFLTWVSTSE